MKPPVSWWWTALVGLVIAAALPVVGHQVRKDDRPRCNRDGLLIDTAFRVRVRDATEAFTRFCDVGCARSWIDRQSAAPQQILVTDEDSGEMLDAREAFFVRSSIITNRVTGNRWHVFLDRDRAKQHAKQSRGRLMVGPDHPFFSTESP